MPLDEDCARYIRETANAPALPPDPQARLAEMRARAEAMGRFGLPPEPMHSVRDLHLPDVRLRTFTPVSDGPLPVLVWVHGGSWTRGSLTSHDGLYRAIASGAQVVVVAVDYTLAPEARFPHAIGEVLTALRWATAHAGEVGGDKSSVSVGGDSSGGNLAAAAALVARDRDIAIAQQVLLVPLLDTHFTSLSWDACGDGYLLTRAQLEWALDLYAPGHDRNDPLLSPVAAPSLAGLPPAIIVTGEYDPLRDDGAAYARRLREVGVAVEYKEWPGMIHHAPLAAQAMPAGAAAVRHIADLMHAGRVAAKPGVRQSGGEAP
jgi:acetyl esterase/lipase